MSSEQEGRPNGLSESALPRVTQDGMTTSEMNTVLISRYRVLDHEGARVVVAEDAPSIRLFVIPGLVATLHSVDDGLFLGFVFGRCDIATSGQLVQFIELLLSRFRR